MRDARVNAGRLNINELVRHYDGQLRAEFGGHLFQAGWCLLLGRHYGESPIVYFSLNPGLPRSRAPVDPVSRDEWNVPFLNPPELQREYVYLRNCQRFFASDILLRRTIEDRISSAFLIPWRTRNLSDLTRLNAVTGGKVWEYSRQIAKTVIADHQATLLLAVGKAAVRLLADLQVARSLRQQTPFLGPGGSYQWSRWQAEVDSRPLTILQIPHFSRANSPSKLAELAGWLRAELAPFLPAGSAIPKSYTRE